MNSFISVCHSWVTRHSFAKFVYIKSHLKIFSLAVCRFGLFDNKKNGYLVSLKYLASHSNFETKSNICLFILNVTILNVVAPNMMDEMT